ncbi:hypothetical protein [Clostridium sp. C2-6-12]|uniref:hypothetical protein n=1 Tax=Clostridium sp. C2-6-12 TaxID=2698832 RepID=UPI00136E2F43|nr:hypothetical protein [Clostridium sp. C2-6-12]
MRCFDLDWIKIETKQQKKYLLLIIISVFLSVILTLITYPGILYSDSCVRWDSVFKILSSSSKFNFKEIDSWISITPQFFMAILYMITYNISSFTIIQSFLFFLTTFILIDKCVFGTYKLFAIIIFIITPIFYTFSVYHSTEVGFIIGSNLYILLVVNFNEDNPKIKKVIHFLFLVLSSYCMFGFRQNAFTVLPIFFLICVYFYRKKKNIHLLLLRVSALLMGLSLVFMVPSILNIKVYDSSTAGFSWEILSTINQLGQESKIEYINYLDEIGGQGSTNAALQKNAENNESVNPWLWSILKPDIIGESNNAQKVKEKYFELMKNEPKAFLKNKFKFILSNLGITHELADLLEYNVPDSNYIKINNTSLRTNFIKSYHLFHSAFSVIRQPYIWFVLGILAVCYAKIIKHESFIMLAFLLLISVFYYGGFIINTQSFEFRYFFPSFYYLFLVFILGLMILFSKISSYIYRYYANGNSLKRVFYRID